MTMRPESLSELRALHEKKRSHPLDREEATRYRAGVDRLLQSALARQEAEAPPGGKRRAVRVRRAVAVDLHWSTHQARSLTLDLGTGGFAAFLGTPPPDGPLVAVLHVRRGAPVKVAARVASAWTARGRVRTSFAFTDVPDVEAARLQDYVVEELLPAPRPSVEAAFVPQSGFVTGLRSPSRHPAPASP